MGAGAVSGISAAINAATKAELKEAFAGLTPEERKKIQQGLSESPAGGKNLKDMKMGKFTDEECAGMIKGMLDQTMKGPPPDLLRKVRPFLMPEYKTKVSIGQDAPDGKVYELDGSETTLLAKISSMGHGPGKLIVLNFGSYTCPVHRGKQPDVSAICKELAVDLLQVYIIEAHPVDEWSGGEINGVEYKQTKTLEDRIKIAKVFQEDKAIKDNIVVDDMQNPCNDAYEACATKLYVLEGGKIIWRTGMSPFQYDVEGLKNFLATKKGSA